VTIDEQRLSQLLKGSVPHPPHVLSADQVTTRQVDRSGKSWALPALAAAAVVAIGVTVGVLAANHAGGGAPSPASPGSGRVPAAGTPTATASGSARPSSWPQSVRVPVPNVIGMTQATAIQVLMQAGFTVNVMTVPPPAGQSVPPGTVYEQTRAAGSVAARGALITLYVVPRPTT
jgi:hypothetical protein